MQHSITIHVQVKALYMPHGLTLDIGLKQSVLSAGHMSHAEVSVALRWTRMSSVGCPILDPPIHIKPELCARMTAALQRDVFVKDITGRPICRPGEGKRSYLPVPQYSISESAVGSASRAIQTEAAECASRKMSTSGPWG